MRTRSRVHTATLDCGTVLAFEARSFLPTRGESVPCRRHGHCLVTGLGREPEARTARPRSLRAPRRDEEELLEWLRMRSVATVHTLRRERFTLRIIAAAERDGLVEIDPVTDTVVLR
jgi:hypothetical protein